MAATDEALRAKAQAFRKLHEQGTFIMPCAWDPASAALFEAAGFVSLGTTSGGVNWSQARADYVYAVDRSEMLAAYQSIVSATSLPVSGDLENGYGDTIADVQSTIAAAIGHGMVGGSIEDQSSESPGALLPVALAAERIAAARATADELLPDFTLTARAESFFGEIADPMSDAIERAHRYVAAGANCIFVPGAVTPDQLALLVAEIPAPISLGIGVGGGDLTTDILAEIGVRRISTGGAIPRMLYAKFLEAATEMHTAGTFTFTADAISDVVLESHFIDDQGPKS